jgi:hypothetical protein
MASPTLPLELPGGAAGVDPRSVRVRAAVLRGGAAVRIGHADQIVGGRLVVADRLDGAVDDVDLVLFGGLNHRRRRIELRRHPPGARISLGEADEVGAVGCRARDVGNRLRNIGLVLARTMGDRLHDGNAEGHGAAPLLSRRCGRRLKRRGGRGQAASLVRRAGVVAATDRAIFPVWWRRNRAAAPRPRPASARRHRRGSAQ